MSTKKGRKKAKKGGHKRAGRKGYYRKAKRRSTVTVGAAKVLRMGDLTAHKVKSKKRLPKHSKCVRNGRDPATKKHYYEVKRLTGKALEKSKDAAERRKARNSPLGKAWLAENKKSRKSSGGSSAPYMTAEERFAAKYRDGGPDAPYMTAEQRWAAKYPSGYVANG